MSERRTGAAWQPVILRMGCPGMWRSTTQNLFCAQQMTVQRSRIAIGVFVVTALSLQCHQAAVDPGSTWAASPGGTQAARVATSAAALTGSDVELARRDPLAYLESCLEHYRSSVRDYRCVFEKQEQIDGKVLPPQTAEVNFREEPYSVDMNFTENVRDCKRALYVAGAWTNSAGEPLVWAKPGGAILRAIVPKIQQPVHGKRAQAASRRTIDEFGFCRTLEVILKYSLKARAAGELEMACIGEGEIDGRPTVVFERRLPYNGDENHYPDRLLVVHIDREWKVPTAVYSYADDEGRELLGSYVFSDVALNTGLTSADFDPDQINF